MKLVNSLKFLLPVLIGLLLLSSCELIGIYGKVPDWTVSINEVVKYPRATMGEKEVSSFDGRPIWVRKHYEFNSKSIKSIEAIPIDDKPGFYKLKLELDRHGSLVAMRLCNDHAHDPWAMLINNVFYRNVTFVNAAMNDDYSIVELEGPFDKTVADFLEKYASKNYKYYHRND
jgi:hypothetical protein